MSGHSKWSQIKRQKGAADVRRGAAFTKVTREIVIAAREGGPDPDGNYKLRLAVDKARSVNMPQENIKRAIERATGPGQAERYEEVAYEGYGPGGVALLVETATDNRNRTAADIRSIFGKHGGQLGGAGSVAWQFEPRGVISASPQGQEIPSDEIALLAIDAGATDVDTDADLVEIYTEPADLERVRTELERSGVKVESAEISMIAKMPTAIDASRARQNLRLVEALEEHDDVQRVTANFELPEEVFAEAAAG
jgi:YebC/PmpR family DNA-binding regulatory protein